MNCSDRIENKLFKDTLIHYKAYLMKSGYKEADINKKFINFAIKKKRKSILKKTNKNKPFIQKYRFVTNFAPSFPDIDKGFRKFKRILEDDKELMEAFSHGVKHFQVTQIHIYIAPTIVSLQICWLTSSPGGWEILVE